MPWLAPITLTGRHATLAPLSQTHHDDLVEAVKDGEFWNLWYTIIPKPEAMRAEIDRRLGLQQQGAMLPWAVLAAGKAVGITTYMNVDSANRAWRLAAPGTEKASRGRPSIR